MPILVAAGLALTSGAGGCAAEVDCSCPDAQVCVRGVCREPCNSNLDCAAGVCARGVCALASELVCAGPSCDATPPCDTCDQPQGGSGGPITTAPAAPFVLFQEGFVTDLPNRDGGGVKANGVSLIYSLGVYADPNVGGRSKFLAVDRGNHRLLVFNDVPASGRALPDVVVGQADLVSGDANAGLEVVSGAGLRDPVHASICDNGALFVADRLNNRVLVYRRVPTVSGQVADFAIGQPDLVSSSPETTASGLRQPYAAYCIEDRVLVVDKDNHRVLIFDSALSGFGASADVVIGQPDFVSGGSGCAADRLNLPYEVLYHAGMLLIVDGANHRVLVFDGLPTTNGAAASAVLGQSSMTSCSPNQGSIAPSASSLSWPTALAAQSNVVAVNDPNNNRVLFFSLPIASGQAAFAQLGQADFTSAVLHDPPGPLTIAAPAKGLVFAPGHLWVAAGRNRVVVAPLPF